jgi:transcriptional regulator with XRE-family HTH domain
MNKAGKVFSANLVRLMAVRPDLDTQVKVAQASGVAQTTVGRILRGDVSPTLDNVENIANAFGKTTGEMINSAYNSAAEIAYDRVKYSKLPKEEKSRVESYIEHAIREYDAVSAREQREFNHAGRTPVATSSKKAEGPESPTFNSNGTTPISRGVKRRKAG